MFGGDPTRAAALVRRAWDRAAPEDAFLVYDGQYDVQPSPTRSWVDPDREGFEEAIKRLREDGGSAGWYA